MVSRRAWSRRIAVGSGGSSGWSRSSSTTCRTGGRRPSRSSNTVRVLALPAPVDAFLKKPNAAVIGVVRPDGFPMTVVTWYDWEDGRVLVNMNDSRKRLRWIRRDPKVSLTVFDDDWYRHVSLWGEASELRRNRILFILTRWP